MSKEREALKLALECVEAWDRGCDRDPYWRDIEAAVTAIKEALAEPEPRNQCAETCERAKLCAICAMGLEMSHPPAQRKPLTDEEIKTMWRCSKIYGTNEEKALALARAIEAAHGITGEQA